MKKYCSCCSEFKESEFFNIGKTVGVCENCYSILRRDVVNLSYSDIEELIGKCTELINVSKTSAISKEMLRDQIEWLKQQSPEIQNKIKLLEEKKIEDQRKFIEFERKMMEYLKNGGVKVTTSDFSEKYEVLTPIIFNTTNRGIFSSAFTDLKRKYSTEDYKKILITTERSHSRSTTALSVLSLFDASFSFEGDVGQSQFDLAFYIALAEMRIRAYKLGGNGITGLKMDFDLDTTNYSAFYLQMYGTVVKFIEPEVINASSSELFDTKPSNDVFRF